MARVGTMMGEKMQANHRALLAVLAGIIDEKMRVNNVMLAAMINEKNDAKLEPVLEVIQAGFEQTASTAEPVSLRHELMAHTDHVVTNAFGKFKQKFR